MTQPRARAKGRKAQEKLLAALLANPSFEQAAKAAGISPSTGLRWRKDPEFQERYRQLRERMLESAVNSLHNSALTFADTLREICIDKDAHPSARAQAARNGLEGLMRVTEHFDILKRLEALEKSAGEAQ
ncbi:MAG TPA: hypothetical protein VHU83_06370 [Bryobacteraceae bacterium]|jgi:hypothetical protein|nr:hypothetical protein [Bryobacteraceae bacterium]